MSFFPVKEKTQSKIYDCSTCGLDKISTKKSGVGNQKSDIFIIGESQKKENKILKKILKKHGVDLKSDCFLTNVVRCNPPEDKSPTIKEAKCCSQYLDDEIKKVKPKVIVLLGSIACKAILGDGSIYKFGGYHIFSEKYNCYIIPTCEPVEIMWEEISNFEKHIQNINEIKDKKFDFKDFKKGNTILDNADDILNLLQSLVDEKMSFALDWETYGLRPYNKDSIIVSCGIAIGQDESYTFLMEDHWRADEWEKIKIGFQKLFTSKCVKMFFNYKFEKDWSVNRLGADINGDVRDMMYAAYLHNENRGTHNLNFQSLVNFGVGKLKGADKYMSDMRKCPRPLLHDYNGRDARLTYALGEPLWDSLNEREKNIYDTLLLPGAEALLKSEMDGVLLSKDIMGEVKDRLVEKRESILKDLKIFLVNHNIISGDAKKEDVTKALNSTAEISNLLFTVLKLPSIKKTPKGFNCVDKEVLESLQGDQPFCASLLEYRDLMKLISTYLDGLKDVMYDDGLLHPSFNLHLTETGRLSGTNPNMQNIPKRKNSFVREMFVPPKGHVIMSFDYSGAEVRCMAMASRDKTLVKYIKDKYDMHQFWADRIQEVTGRETIRREGKSDFVFPSFYGASYKSIAKSLNIKEGSCEKLQNELFEEFSGMKKWQEKVTKFFDDNGYIDSLLGRRRYAPLKHNQIINTPIQSLASDFTLLSLIETKKLGYRMCWTIHDDNSYYIPEDKIKDSYEEIKGVMINWDFDFINVPLEIDCSIGENWFKMISIEEVL